MLKNLLVFVKYPSVSGIIATIWIGSTILVVYDRSLPVIQILVVNAFASIMISMIGFRVDKA